MDARKKTVCLLGSSGFLGSAIASELDAQNIPWVGINASTRVRPHDYLFSEVELQRIPEEISGCEFIINAAGSWKPRTVEAAPEEALKSMLKLAEFTMLLAGRSSVKKIVQISSAGTVYGEQGSRPHRETDQPAPLSWYGRAKLLEESYYERKCREESLELICARVTNPFGNRRKTSHGLVDVLISTCRAKSEFFTYADANPFRDFIYAPDMAFYVVSLMKGSQVGIFNVGAGVSHSAKSLCRFVQNNYGYPKLVESIPRPKFDVLRNEVDTARLVQACGIRETFDVISYMQNELEDKEKVQLRKHQVAVNV